MTDGETYPRDMIGYGRTPPFADWPKRARVAAAVRHQLRGGRREQYPARRRRVRSVPVRDHRRRALARHAPHEHGVDLRIRLAGRLLAAAPPVHGTLGSGHRLCGRDRDGAQSRGGRGDERSGVGDRDPRPEMDRLSRRSGRSRSGPHRRGDRASMPRSPALARSASIRAARRSTRSGSGWRRAGFYCADSMPTICLTGSKARAGRS